MKHPLLLALLSASSLFAADPNGTSRDVKYKPTDIVALPTQIRFTTLIELPEAETILEATCGDKDNWEINWTGNLGYIKPGATKVRTNINLVTQSGHVYSFIAYEVTGSTTPADLKLFVTPTDNSALVTLRDKPRFVPVADFNRETKRADAAEAKLSAHRETAQAEIAKEKTEALAVVTASLVHDYEFKSSGKRPPFNLSAIYHDDKFTYIEGTPIDAPAVYEWKDGRDSLILFEYDASHHRYTISKVLDEGYLRIGKNHLKFKRQTKVRS